jgi:aspartate/methionine/tyrosine aminotransferase
VVGPAAVLADIRLVGLTNVVCQVGIAQSAVAAALTAPDADADVAAATAIWQRRCEGVLGQLAGYPAVRPHGGWSLLIDTKPLGLTPGEASRRLFDRGRVAATPMDGWGPSGESYLRVVFANEPVERLDDLGRPVPPRPLTFPRRRFTQPGNQAAQASARSTSSACARSSG